MKVNFYIDGFNLYHSINSYAKTCKWLNLYDLCTTFLKKGEEIGTIYYFTAYTFWDTEKVSRHKTYIAALKLVNVKIIFGKFKAVTRHCTKRDKICDRTFDTHEEKQTDVNIAMQLLEDAFKNAFDTAIIVSGDSDLVPPIKRIKSNFPFKRVGILSPIGRKTKELQQASDFSLKITKDILLESRFPVVFNNLTCPRSWHV